jgi:TolB-like protein/class 3 adenylate cyclase/Flp pilus assembly protein TadD
MERRLAAVMIADVAGYGRLSQADEEGTRARFQSDLHEVFEPQIAAHHGRLVKTMGDGLLVEFHSVVDAVRCAIDVQRTKAERNARELPERRMAFRIGINLGDVIVEGEDIHGDGVIITERLQALADPGGLLISGTAYDHVEKKIDVGYEFLGEQLVKNIDKPVRTYRLLMGADDAGKTIGVVMRAATRSWRLPAIAATLVVAIAAGFTAWLTRDQPTEKPPVAALPSDGPSIAVLPFKSMSSDVEQGYLADGLTEDMTTDLARVPGLLVVSRNAAFQYKDRAVDPVEVAAKLRVRYILEGSVRRVGDELRINAQLIDGETGVHKWAERFDGNWADVFTLQDKVIQNVVSALELRLVPGQKTAQAPGGTGNPDAYDAYLQGLELVWRDTAADLAKAVPHLERAVALDPNYGEALAALAQAYRRAGSSTEWEQAVGASSYADTAAKAVAYLQEALKHPSPRAFRIDADLRIYAQQHDEAIADLERAIALDPSDYESYAWMAYAMNLAGRPEDGQRYIEAALRLDPRAVELLVPDIGFAQFSAGRFADAAATLEKHFAANPESGWSGALLAAAYGHLGGDATSLVQQLDALAVKNEGVGFTQLLARTWIPYKEREDAARLRDGLRKAGVPELPFGYDPLSKDRLTDEEIKTALYGHTLRGKDIDTGATWTLVFEPDGAFTFTSDSQYRSAPSESGRIVEIDNRVMCWGYPTTGSRGCGTLFRAPGDAAAEKNRLLWVAHVDRILFSVAE